MKKIFVLVFGLILGLSVTAYAADGFIDGMEDIPVADKMVQISADNISFGNEETRLVEAYLKANFMKFTQVKRFYLDTLPQLGWKLISEDNNKLVFTRDAEELDIAQESKLPLIVRVTLTGRP